MRGVAELSETRTEGAVSLEILCEECSSRFPTTAGGPVASGGAQPGSCISQ